MARIVAGVACIETSEEVTQEGRETRAGAS
jgi:hypothetical protein